MSGRLPSLLPIDLDEPQRKLYDSLMANELGWADRSRFQVIATDGSLLGPFNPMLFSPVLGTAWIGVFRTDKSHTSLSPHVHEVVVLTVGAAWNSAYELYAHATVAKATGLSDEVIEAIVAGQPPDFQSEEEAIAHEFTWQLTQTHRVPSDLYTRASQVLGERGLVDMVLLIGLYLAACSIINAFEVSAPAGGSSAGPQHPDRLGVEPVAPHAERFRLKEQS